MTHIKTSHENLISCKALYKTFKNGDNIINALSNIDVAFEPACFATISGPSGSGKSTLLNIIGMIDEPDQGEVYICGKRVNYQNQQALEQDRKDRIGFIFQNFNLIPTLTALENVALPLLMGSLNAVERMDRAKACLDSVDLHQRLHHFPRQLSGGQQQRVAIARALVNDPAIILADEPTANLDSQTGTQIMELMLQMREERKVGFLFSTHDHRIIKKALQVILLKDGKIVAQ